MYSWEWVCLKGARFYCIVPSEEDTPMVLVLRLGELKKMGLIKPVVIQSKPRLVRWELTKMGRDTIPTLMSSAHSEQDGTRKPCLRTGRDTRWMNSSHK